MSLRGISSEKTLLFFPNFPALGHSLLASLPCCLLGACWQCYSGVWTPCTDIHGTRFAAAPADAVSRLAGQGEALEAENYAEREHGDLSACFKII